VGESRYMCLISWTLRSGSEQLKSVDGVHQLEERMKENSVYIPYPQRVLQILNLLVLKGQEHEIRMS
jgi:hypothetical protein